MFTVSAPDGIGEIRPGDDLASIVLDAVKDLADGDIVCVTSKIVSKAEGRTLPASSFADALAGETAELIARRPGVRIVRNRQGIVQAAAGIDGSNVAPDAILLLPADPDASARRLRAGLQERAGVRLGVVISDTAGRAWRTGQTDHAIGAAGIRVSVSLAGERDAYGNDLRVTETAVADELAAAADLAKGKLAGRPVAVIRGLAHLVIDADTPARTLQRAPADDLFARGTREAVMWAVLVAAGQQDRYAELAELDGPELTDAVTAAANEATVRAIIETLSRP